MTDLDRTEGMTRADMVAAISTMYGTTVKPPLKPVRAPLAAIDEGSGTRVAGWGNGDYAAVRYRSSHASGLSMVVTSVRLNALVRTAEVPAAQLDERELIPPAFEECSLPGDGCAPTGPLWPSIGTHLKCSSASVNRQVKERRP